MISREEGRNELVYQMTMSFARNLLEKELISQAEYDEFDTQMRQKYQPIFGTLWL